MSSTVRVVCGAGAVNGAGGSLDSSQTTETRQGLAVYESKKNEQNIKFKSYAEKYAYLRGKAVCDPCPAPT